MLEGELNTHLGYSKNQKSDNPNGRNGYSEKKLRTFMGESNIHVPRNRYATFNPMIVPKRGNMVDGLENIIVSFYASRKNNNDKLFSEIELGIFKDHTRRILISVIEKIVRSNSLTALF